MLEPEELDALRKLGPSPFMDEIEELEIQPSLIDVIRHDMEEAHQKRLNRPGAFDVIHKPNRAERRYRNKQNGLRANGLPKH